MRRRSDVLAVSFDVGGTLIEPWPSVGHVYAAIAREAGLPEFAPEHLTARFMAAWRAKVGFDYSRAAWADLVVSTFDGSVADYGVESALFQRLFNRFTEAAAWRIHDDVVPVLRALSERGLKLAVISNWDERLRPLLRNLELEKFFEVIVVSAECACHKPDPELFLRAVRGLGVRPHQVLHVGDSPLEDVQGAQSAGLQALMLTRSGPARASREISTLRDLLSAVRYS